MLEGWNANSRFAFAFAGICFVRNVGNVCQFDKNSMRSQVINMMWEQRRPKVEAIECNGLGGEEGVIICCQVPCLAPHIPLVRYIVSPLDADIQILHGELDERLLSDPALAWPVRTRHVHVSTPEHKMTARSGLSCQELRNWRERAADVATVPCEGKSHPGMQVDVIVMISYLYI